MQKNGVYRRVLSITLSMLVSSPAIAFAADGPAHEAQPRTGIGRALLVGIDRYSPSAAFIENQAKLGRVFDSSRSWNNLRGTENDVKAMAAMLKTRYGFTEVKTLLNEQATRKAILDGLAQLSHAGPQDRVVFFYSGHGSQAPNPGALNPEHLDQTLVPADAPFSVPDIRDKELKLCFNEVLDVCTNLTVIVDACHSRSIARSPFADGAPKTVEPGGPGTRAEHLLDLPDITRRANAQLDPVKRGALLLEACDANQTAKEVLDAYGNRRGALALALTDTMQEVSERESALGVFRRVSLRVREITTDQEPFLDAGDDRKAATLFGGPADAVDGTAVTALPRKPYLGNTEVEFAAGFAMGLRPGMKLELKPRVDQPSTASVAVQLTRVDGPELSRGVVVQGKAEQVRGGELFHLNEQHAVSEFALGLWAPEALSPTPAHQALVLGLADLPAASKLLTQEPAEATHNLRWEGQAWRLQGPFGAPVVLGPSPSAKGVADAVLASTQVATLAPVIARPPKLFVSLPPAPALLAGLKKEIAMHPTMSFVARDAADYQLVVRTVAGKSEYAWVRPQLETTVSGMPKVTSWVGAGAGESEPAALVTHARTLAKIKGWLDLRSPANNGLFPYQLRLDPTGDVVAPVGLRQDGVLREGEQYRVVLHAERAPKARDEKRFVYVFAIDESGNSELVYPRQTEDGSVMFPSDKHVMEGTKTIPLLEQPITVAGPNFGAETFVLLTTVTPLADPSVLAFEGVRDARKGVRNCSPFEQLLEEINSGTRSITVGKPVRFTPSSWSIERLVFRSVPKGK
jgi:hypothetical protein